MKIIKDRLITALSLGFIASLIYALIHSVLLIISNNYIAYGMYRICHDIIRDSANSYALRTAIIIMSLFALKSILLIYSGKSNNDRIKMSPAILAAAVIAAALYIAFTVFFYLKMARSWVIPAVNAAVIFISAIFFIILKKTDWIKISNCTDNILDRLKIFRALRTSVILILLLIILNAYLFISDRMLLPRERPNVIVLLVDALRANHLGIYGYERQTTPNIDRFARGQRTYVMTNAISQCSWTSPSVASFFSALYPSTHGCTTYSVTEDSIQAAYLDRRIVTLAEAFRERGYSTGAFAANHWINRSLHFSQGFEKFDNINSDYKPRADKLNKKAEKWIRRNSGQPFFAYLHYMDVHAPYRPPSPYDTYYNSMDTKTISQKDADRYEFMKNGGRLDVAHYMDMYDGEISYTDEMIGNLLDDLESHGLLDNTIVIITADHGEAFYEHGYMDHGWTLYSEEINIPLIIRYPEKMSFPDIPDEKIQLIDISQTLFGISGIRLPYETGAWELIPGLNASFFKDRVVFSEELSSDMKGAPKRALLSGTYKAVFYIDEDTLPELYDLDEDPGETVNIAKREKVLADGLKERMVSWTVRQEDKKAQIGIRSKLSSLKDRGKIKELKSLGYLQ